MKVDDKQKRMRVEREANQNFTTAVYAQEGWHPNTIRMVTIEIPEPVNQSVSRSVIQS